MYFTLQFRTYSQSYGVIIARTVVVQWEDYERTTRFPLSRKPCGRIPGYLILSTNP